MLNYDEAVNYSINSDTAATKHAAAASFNRALSNCVIASFLVLATIVGVAELPFFAANVKKKMISFGAPIGMRQAWRVFAPDLRTLNWHTLCLIESADGTLKAKEFPRMDKLSLYERWRQEKKRSVLGERIAHPVYKDFKPAIARFYARSNDDQSNRPVRVTFVFASAPMPPLKKSLPWVYRDQLPEHTAKQVFFSYAVRPEDLK